MNALGGECITTALTLVLHHSAVKTSHALEKEK